MCKDGSFTLRQMQVQAPELFRAPPAIPKRALITPISSLRRCYPGGAGRMRVRRIMVAGQGHIVGGLRRRHLALGRVIL